MKAKTLLVWLLSSLMLLSCGNEPPKLLDETQEGLGTLACLINGELIVAQGRIRYSKGFSTPRVYGLYNPLTNQFTLNAHTEQRHSFQFFISNPRLGHNVIDSVFFWPELGSHYYVARNVQNIRLTRFDSDIASGIFAFDANDYDRHTHEPIPNRQIQVRRGRFDVRLR